jgi:cephalosporin-C deacetylase-like acetyl esterase
MKKILFILGFLCYSLAQMAQIRGNEICVIVSPDHLDWNYKLGEKCTFVIRVCKAQNLLPDVTVDYELGPEMYPIEKRKGIVLKGGELTLKGIMGAPGFLRCKITAHVGDKSYEGLATAAFAPEELRPVTEFPVNFQEFWATELLKARETPLKPFMLLIPERCTDKVNVYQVSFQVDRPESRFYGILCIPKKEGKYPALLRVPGAGVRPYAGDVYTASLGAITLEVGIHGIPVTMDQVVYDNLANGALNCYWTFCRNDLKTFYYHRVIIGALRAVDLICSLPQFNHQALGVTGSSQGGALSVMTAALDSRVTFLAAVHPALCDHEAYFKKRAAGWPHYFYYYGKPDAKELEVTRYYDTANFARCLTAPGWFSWGYNDEVCPPTSMFAVYNVVSSPKEFHPYLQTGHYWYQEQWDEWESWLLEKMNLKD